MFPSTILWRANYCRLHSTSPSSRNQPIGLPRSLPAAGLRSRSRSAAANSAETSPFVTSPCNNPRAPAGRPQAQWPRPVIRSANARCDGLARPRRTQRRNRWGGASLGRPSCLRSRSWTRPSRTWTTSYKYARGSRASSARIATPPRPTTRPRSPSTSTASGSMPASSYNFGRAAVSDRHTT
jgi:hypothetical protein